MAQVVASYNSLRICLAFLTAPIVPAFVLASLFLLPNGSRSLLDRLSLAMPMGIIAAAYALLATVIFGVPIYLLLRSRLVPSLLICSISGAFIAYLPLLSLRLLILFREGQSELARPADAWIVLFGAVAE